MTWECHGPAAITCTRRSRRTCSDCHAGTRPIGPVGTPAFDHAANDGAGLGDCKSCHLQSATTLDWSGGSFSHDPAPTACLDCHLGKRPVGLAGSPPFDHANGGMGDCVSCHQPESATQTDWSGASFSHSPAPASCSGCHASKRPTGLVGNPPFDHALAGMGDCKSCHQPESATQTDWSGGSFSHSPAPATCIECHAAKRPMGQVGTPPFDHALAGMGDCKSCHLPKSATQTDWTGGSFSHSPAPATCIDCHLADRPATVVNGFDHSATGTGDCVDCHHSPGVTWAGGTGFDHNALAPATRCDSCHAAQRPAAAINVAWTGHPNNPNKFLHSVVVSIDCKACHMDAGGVWAGWGLHAQPESGSMQCLSFESASRWTRWFTSL